MATKYGVFSEPAYLSPGIQYRHETKQKKKELDPPNIKASISRSGKGNDAMFEPFKPLFVNEPYSSVRRDPMQPLERPWRSPSPMKRSSGLGDLGGTFGPRIEYLPQRRPQTGIKPEPSIRRIYTSPAKKGHFRSTLSEIYHPHGVVSEYSYVPSPYKSNYEVQVEYERQKRSKRFSELPFKPSSANRSKFKGIGICGEYAYVPQGEQKPERRMSFPTPFRPAGLPRDVIGKFPEFIPERNLTDLRKPNNFEKDGVPWRPSSSFKTDCTRSIVRMNA